MTTTTVAFGNPVITGPGSLPFGGMNQLPFGGSSGLPPKIRAIFIPQGGAPMMGSGW